MAHEMGTWRVYAPAAIDPKGNPVEPTVRAAARPKVRQRQRSVSGLPLFSLAEFNAAESDASHLEVIREGWRHWRESLPLRWVNGRPYPANAPEGEL